MRNGWPAFSRSSIGARAGQAEQSVINAQIKAVIAQKKRAGGQLESENAVGAECARREA
jgi:hypothetical protein